MPIAINRDGPAQVGQGSRALRLQMEAALDLMQFGRLFRGQGQIDAYNQVRIDNQSVWSAGPGDNIQAQYAANSIAAIRIANELSTAATPADQAAVVEALGQAMRSSYADGSWWEVTGTSP